MSKVDGVSSTKLSRGQTSLLDELRENCTSPADHSECVGIVRRPISSFEFCRACRQH